LLFAAGNDYPHQIGSIHRTFENINALNIPETRQQFYAATPRLLKL